jgi:hypothetical protein
MFYTNICSLSSGPDDREPGTLRAVITAHFTPRPVSPSHCEPYLPPALTVRLRPR